VDHKTNFKFESIIQSIYDNSILQLLRESNQSSFDTSNSQFTISPFYECKSRSQILHHRQSFILIAGADFRFTLRLFYSYAEIWSLLKFKFPKKLSFEETSLQSFAKEFCNLWGGAVKRRLHDVGTNAGLSLPVSSRGFDELFHSKNKSTRLQAFDWKAEFSSAPGNPWQKTSDTLSQKHCLFFRFEIFSSDDNALTEIDEKLKVRSSNSNEGNETNSSENSSDYEFLV
jgi:hypothetical protein